MSVEEAPPVRRLPGLEGLWVFLGFDAVIFLLVFGSFAKDRHADPVLFEASRLTLDLNLGGLDTLILLTSSWLVALAVRAATLDEWDRSSRFLLGGVLTGVLFVVSKSIEYAGKWASGIGPVTNTFYMWYFVITGAHLLHVVAGTVALAVMWRSVSARSRRPRLAVLESVACFWHLVDLLWIVIFPLLYLQR